MSNIKDQPASVSSVNLSARRAAVLEAHDIAVAKLFEISDSMQNVHPITEEMMERFFLWNGICNACSDESTELLYAEIAELQACL